MIDNLDKNINFSRAIDGTDYLPGFIGLNNLKCTDYVNVVI
jgi:U4/U6.U5 tri-snRNP-associated protein 2